VMLSDSVNSRESADQVKVVDVAQLLLDSVRAKDAPEPEAVRS
jgi:hypothetical protein